MTDIIDLAQIEDVIEDGTEEDEMEEHFESFSDLLSQDSTENWQDLFPWDKFRKYQEPAINAIIKGFQTKRYVIVEGPTGCGKTVLGLTLARLFEDAYLATHQKMLQEQYMSDFSEYLAQLKGRANYPCLRLNFDN